MSRPLYPEMQTLYWPLGKLIGGEANTPAAPKGTKARRHHNNKGLRQIKRGKTREQVKAMAKRLGVPYGEQKEAPTDD